MNPGAGLHRKLSNPSDPLYRHIVNSNPDILGLVETMSIKPSKIPHVPGYFRFFCPANHTGGVPSGGVIVLIKNALKHKVSFVCKSRNVIWLRSKDLNTVWHFAFVYVRTAKEKHTIEISELYENLSLKISEFQEKGSRIALFGDFNARLGSYSGDHATNSNAGQFKSFEEIHNLFLLNKLFRTT